MAESPHNRDGLSPRQLTFLSALIGSAAGSVIALVAALADSDLNFGDAFIYLGNPLSGGFAVLGGLVGARVASRRTPTSHGAAWWVGCLVMIPAAWLLTLLTWAAIWLANDFGL